MSKGYSKKVAIVDYGMGNLFSVMQASIQAGLSAEITNSRQGILSADAVILPGVGSFGDAMKTLVKLDLDVILREVATSNTPLLGICLGMQLLMTESEEFGSHKGLGIIDGHVSKLELHQREPRAVKIPHVGWNRIRKPVYGPANERWGSTLLSEIPNDEYMYFVHSFYAEPADNSVITSITSYGSSQFCSSVQKGSVFACQFHPERSGVQGLKMYHNLAQILDDKKFENARRTN